MKIFLLVGVLTSIMALVYSTPLPVAASESTEHTFAEESRTDSTHGHQHTHHSSWSSKEVAEDLLDQVTTTSIPSQLDIDESTSGEVAFPSALIGKLADGSVSASDKDVSLPVPSGKLDSSMYTSDKDVSVPVPSGNLDSSASTSGKEVSLPVPSGKLDSSASTSGKEVAPSDLISKLNFESTSGQDVFPSALIGKLDPGVSTSGHDVAPPVPNDQLDTVPALNSHARDSASNPSESSVAGQEAGAVHGDGSLVASSDVSEKVQTSGSVSTSGVVVTRSEEAQQTATQHRDNEQHANDQPTSSEGHKTLAQFYERRGIKSIDNDRDQSLMNRPRQEMVDRSARLVDNMRMRGMLF